MALAAGSELDDRFMELGVCLHDSRYTREIGAFSLRRDTLSAVATRFEPNVFERRAAGGSSAVYDPGSKRAPIGELGLGENASRKFASRLDESQLNSPRQRGGDLPALVRVNTVARSQSRRASTKPVQIQARHHR